MKVLVLGHKGMLGHMVHKYLSTKEDCEIVTTDFRWPTKEFKDFIIDFWYGQEGNYIINCIGAINQKTNGFQINIDLPIWLDENIDYNLSGCKVIHPGTDSGVGEYGKSKDKVEKYILEKGCMTHIIKTSIIGHELDSENSLLEWFLDSKDEVCGYSETYWNGNTTLQWAKICYDLMINWDNNEKLTIPSTECISKYTLLEKIKDTYKKDNMLIWKNSDIKINKCLEGNIKVPSIDKQLKELKEFYYDN